MAAVMSNWPTVRNPNLNSLENSHNQLRFRLRRKFWQCLLFLLKLKSLNQSLNMRSFASGVKSSLSLSSHHLRYSREVVRPVFDFVKSGDNCRDILSGAGNRGSAQETSVQRRRKSLQHCVQRPRHGRVREEWGWPGPNEVLPRLPKNLRCQGAGGAPPPFLQLFFAPFPLLSQKYRCWLFGAIVFRSHHPPKFIIKFKLKFA